MPKSGEIAPGVPARTHAPAAPPAGWPFHPRALYELGVAQVEGFCRLNGVPAPRVTVVGKADWLVGACAFYRPDTPAWDKYRLPGHGPEVNICLEHCGRPCGDAQSRNWTWPGSVTDREPYGVLCHELGHHCDWLAGDRKGSYFSEYCEQVKAGANEPGLTSYADENPAEWLAEAFRLFVTNPSLLRHVRPRTYVVLRDRWQPCETRGWLEVLGPNVPARVVKALWNKGAR